MRVGRFGRTKNIRLSFPIRSAAFPLGRTLLSFITIFFVIITRAPGPRIILAAHEPTRCRVGMNFHRVGNIDQLGGTIRFR